MILVPVSVTLIPRGLSFSLQVSIYIYDDGSKNRKISGGSAPEPVNQHIQITRRNQK